MGILSAILFTPIIAMILLAVMPRRMVTTFKWVALIATLVQGGLFVGSILSRFNNVPLDNYGYQFVEKLDWIRLDMGSNGWLDINYYLGIDGISVLMAGLSILVMFIAVISSWNVTKWPKTFFMLLLLLNTSTFGCFVALDFFLFYIFYELMLLPMFFLIGLWGAERREYAAIKFFLYTLFGSVFMLLIMVGLAFSFVDPIETVNHYQVDNVYGSLSTAQEILNGVHNGLVERKWLVHSFNIPAMMETAPDGSLMNVVKGSLFEEGAKLFGLDARMLAFWVLLIGFAIKVPSVPVHTWLPDAHVQAPTAISVVLAGILLKVGGYGIIRICYGIFPEGGVESANWVAGLGVLSILYAALVAMAQKDFKSLIAYSSISHMGFVLLGIASLEAAGLNGAILQMFNHGVVSAALFLIVGVVYDRTHDRRIEVYKGLWNRMPVYSTVVMISFFASMGLPGLNSFVSEMLVLLGGFGSDRISVIFAALALGGILFSAVYYLRTFRSMFFGEFEVKGDPAFEMNDLNRRELAMFIPLCALMILFGVMPSLLLDLTEGSVVQFLENILAGGMQAL